MADFDPLNPTAFIRGQVLNALGLPGTWRDELLPGSFRGMPFGVLDREGSGGRRVAPYLFPLRDDVELEDLGRGLRKLRLTAFVVGDDYKQARDGLIAALDDVGGAGTLVHPTMGELQVWAEPYRWAESGAEGGYCQFDLEFINQTATPQPAAPDSLLNTWKQIKSALAVAGTVASVALSVTNWSSFLRGVALSSINGLGEGLARDLLGVSGLDLQATRLAIAGIGNADPAAGALTAGNIIAPFTAFADAAAQVAAAPASASQGSLSAGATATTSRGEGEPVLGFAIPVLLQYAAPTPASTGDAGADALRNLVTGLAADAAVLAACLAALSAPFTDAAAAARARDALLAALLARQDAAADALADDLYAAWRALRAPLLTAFTTRLQSLPQVASYATPQPLPSLVLAYRLYGDASRADELVALNQAWHPAAMPRQGKAFAA